MAFTHIAFAIMTSFFAGFFLAWYAVRSAYAHKVHTKAKNDTIQQILIRAEKKASVEHDLIDSSPEIVNVTSLPPQALDRYIQSISQKQAALASERQSRLDEPTLRVGKGGKEKSLLV